MNLNNAEAAKAELAKRELARRSLLYFTTYTFPGYDVADFHKQYADILQKFIEGQIKRLIIGVPAQHGKSELSSRRLPAFAFGKNQDLRIAICGYSDTFASKFNRQIQRIMDSSPYANVFPHVKIPSKGSTEGVRNNHEFEIIGHRGSLISVGIGGSLTGNPVDLAIIDDPYKDYEQAFSPVYREKVWEWYESVLEKRLHNDSQIAIIMTRWHYDDLVGRILRNQDDGKTTEKWECINFPAIKDNEQTYYDKREQGEALWPERHSLEKLLNSRSKNPALFEAMDQGRPPKESKNQFFDEFDYQKCTTREAINIDRQLILTLSFDFNRNPCTVLIGQRDPLRGIRIIEGIQSPGGTEALLEKLEWVKDGDFALEITGDNSGHSEKSSARYTDYQLIENFFRVSVSRVTKKANSLHIHSRKICNYIFRNCPIQISEKGCPKLINELINAQATKDGKLVKDDGMNRNDLVDAFRYMMNLWFATINEIDKYVDFLEK